MGKTWLAGWLAGRAVQSEKKKEKEARGISVGELPLSSLEMILRPFDLPPSPSDSHPYLGLAPHRMGKLAQQICLLRCTRSISPLVSRCNVALFQTHHSACRKPPLQDNPIRFLYFLFYCFLGAGPHTVCKAEEVTVLCSDKKGKHGTSISCVDCDPALCHRLLLPSTGFAPISSCLLSAAGPRSPHTSL